MRRVVATAVLVLFLLAGGWLLLGGETPRSVDTAQAAQNAQGRAPVVEVERDRATPKPEATSQPKRSASKEEREAMRRRIVDAMQARERAAEEREEDSAGGDGGRPAPPPREPSAAEPPEDAAPTPGNLTDRTGNHGYLMKVMNEDLMPLADECYALARETQPELQGMLVLDVEILGDEEIGGIVETVTPGQTNELADPGLVECVRESLLSTTLPPPPEGGKDAISLSLRLEPDEG